MRDLFIMCPHADDLHRFTAWKDLIHQAMLDIDPAGVGPGKVANKLFKWGRSLKRISSEDLEQQFRFGAEPRRGQLLSILLRLPCEDKPPGYHFRVVRHFLRGVLRPFRIDSRIPGIESRYRVS